MMNIPVPDNEFVYIGEDEEWHIRDDAPEELRKQFYDFFSFLREEKDGLIILR